MIEIKNKALFTNQNISISELIIEIDENGRFLFISKTFEDVLGYNQEDLLNKYLKEILHPDDSNLSRYVNMLGGADNNPYNNISSFRHKNGNFLYFEWIMNSYKGMEGKQKAVLIFNLIPNFQENKLVVSKEFQNKKYNIFAVTDPKGKIIYANTAFCAISNYTHEELLGEDHRIVNSGFHSKEFFNGIYSTLKEKKIWRGEIRNRAKDGNIYWLDTIIVPVTNKEGILTHYLGIRSNVTEKKKEEEMKISFLNKNTEIEKLLCDLTESTKINDELKLNLLELENLNQTKNKFFSIIAHDLRNPFGGILGLTDIMVAKIEKEEMDDSLKLYHKYIQIVRSSAQSAYILLENLLQWARSQTGEIIVNPKNIPMNYILSLALPVMNAIAFKKNIVIEKDLVINETIFADDSMVNTILRNLITNAIKFTNLNGKVILSTKRKNNFLEISVNDSGVGIEPNTLEQLFKIESKFSKAGTENEKGSGMGLILCKEFVEKQGGTILVESQVGIGSTFTFTLPLSREEENEPNAN